MAVRNVLSSCLKNFTFVIYNNNTEEPCCFVNNLYTDGKNRIYYFKIDPYTQHWVSNNAFQYIQTRSSAITHIAHDA